MPTRRFSWWSSCLRAGFRATPADFTKPFPAGTRDPADAVLLSAILADWGPEERARILANAAVLLRPGGLLLVSETLLDEDRTGPLLPALLSLVMLAAMPGDSFTFSELRTVLEEAGFSVLAHHSHREAGRRRGSLGGDGEISRVHARVFNDPSGRLMVEDLGSTNGTFVNGNRISGQQALNPGDQVRVGQTSMTVEGGAGAPTASRPTPRRPNRRTRRRSPVTTSPTPRPG